MVLHVLHRKQSMCHRLPANNESVSPSCNDTLGFWGRTKFESLSFLEDLIITMSAIGERYGRRRSCKAARRRRVTYLATAFARVYDLILLHGRLWITRGHVHVVRSWVARTHDARGKGRTEVRTLYLDRRIEPLRRLACSIHGTLARGAHIHPTRSGLGCERAGLLQAWCELAIPAVR